MINQYTKVVYPFGKDEPFWPSFYSI